MFDTPGIVTATALDIKSEPSVGYRLAVSPQTYVKAASYIARLPQTWTRYDLAGHNCNHMLGAIATGLGLVVPTDYDDLPENYVRSLKSQNGDRERASWKNNRPKG